MKITLSQAEIEQAIKSYMEGLIAVRDGKEMTCVFVTTRSPFTVGAEINIEDKHTVVTVTEVPSSEPVMEPEEETQEEEQQEINQNTVHSLFGNLN